MPDRLTGGVEPSYHCIRWYYDRHWRKSYELQLRISDISPEAQMHCSGASDGIPESHNDNTSGASRYCWVCREGRRQLTTLNLRSYTSQSAILLSLLPSSNRDDPKRPSSHHATAGSADEQLTRLCGPQVMLSLIAVAAQLYPP